MRTNKPITVSLGKQLHVLEELVASGGFESHSEALRAAVRALARERSALKMIWTSQIQEALNDPRPDVAAETVFAELRKRHDAMVKASGGA